MSRAGRTVSPEGSVHVTYLCYCWWVDVHRAHPGGLTAPSPFSFQR